MGRIHLSIFAVLEIYDSFTGNPCKGAFMINLSQKEQKIIKKESGIYVLLSGEGITQQEVLLTGEYFYPQKITITHRDTIYRIGMLPRENYPYPQHTTGILVTSEKEELREESMLSFVIEEKEQKIYLLEDYRKGENEIFLGGIEGNEGQAEYIAYEEGRPCSQSFWLDGRSENGGCLLTQQPDCDLKKGKIQIRRVYQAGSDSQDAIGKKRFFGVVRKRDVLKESSLGEQIGCDIMKNGEIIERTMLEIGKIQEITC